MKKSAIILITLFISAAYAQQQKQSFLGLGQKPICVYDGDYCKDSTDCCSKNCTTSKCMTSNVMAINTNDVNLPQQQQQQQNITLDNRVNKESEVNCQKNNGGGCSSLLKCCNFMTCENNICRDKSVYINGTETLGYNPIQHTYPNNATDLDNRFNENENSSASPTVPAKCRDIGDKCYAASECCTPLKCHSFLHQCVT